MFKQIHQFHPTVSFGDAVSNQILSLQRVLRRQGHQSEIFVQQAPIHFEGRAHQIHKYDRAAAEDTLLLLHFSLGYPQDVLDWLHQVSARKVVIYHNITPAHYFEGINESFYDAALDGREQFALLKPLVQAAWADSSFNCQELIDQDWPNPAVLPIIFEESRYRVRPDRKVLKTYQHSTNILFVGRVVPNKRFEDLLLTFYYVKRFVKPEARLILVGSTRGMESYIDFLQRLIDRLGLADVIFTGHVSTSQLIACYQSADLYLSMSEHEGFGVPLLECMYFQVPILAFKSSAVPETLGHSGILFTEKRYHELAELIGLVLDNSVLQTRLIERQTERLGAFRPENIARLFSELLESV